MQYRLQCSMSKKICLVRGGALTQFSGIGGAHFDLLSHHQNEEFEGVKLLDVLEYPEQNSALAKVRYRWLKHPRAVSKFARTNLGPEDILHITDQEQAHLAPKRYPGRPNVVITVHDLFHLFPYKEKIDIIHEGKVVSKEFVEVGEFSPGLVRKYDLKKLFSGLERADLLICDSEYTRRVCAEKFPNIKAVTVPLGLDIKKYAPANEMQKNKKFEMLFVGSSDKRKRLGFLIDVLSKLESNVVKNSRFNIVGDRSEKTKARSEALSLEVKIHPRLDDDELMNLRQRSDLLLFPSAAEGFGYPPIESMSAGCPVLCSDLPAHNELMPDGDLLPAGDIDCWVSKITKHFLRWELSECKKSRDDLIQHSEKFSSTEFISKMTSAYKL